MLQDEKRQGSKRGAVPFLGKLSAAQNVQGAQDTLGGQPGEGRVLRRHDHFIALARKNGSRVAERAWRDGEERRSQRKFARGRTGHQHIHRLRMTLPARTRRTGWKLRVWTRRLRVGMLMTAIPLRDLRAATSKERARL